MSATTYPPPHVRPLAADPAWLDDDTLDAVRPHVRQLLEQSPGFRALQPDQQRDIARNMVRVAAYMSNPQGLAKEELTPGKSVLARAQDAVDDAKKKASDKVGTFAGKDFTAGAMREGGEQFSKFVGSVDFPKFVGGLIQNVFQAIVDASIQQMNAYAEMLKSVAQTVDQFAQDNISLNNARDWLIDKFPGELGLDDSNAEETGGPSLTVQGDNEEGVLARLNQEMGLAHPVSDLSDPEQEGRLVQSARLQMARSRQQLLASMVMLGINRIVVTDGAINAKVVFDFRSSDTAKRDANASLYDKQSSANRNRTRAGAGGWGWGASTENVNEQKHMTTVSSSVDETSESKATMKAQLTGEVKVNFKSDYFPMEKLASPQMIASIQGNATPADPNVVPQARNAPAPAGH
ncbi:hypothetical protein GCM10007860_33550 [Chitiniphilus shinanonensis]|uniref:Uncharacterized protein n=1 Tax=Chitiniphilus shinanonensis TaxID=553088 RepID=A0ABQ6BYG8_9NEIS|nr:hypothetical protein [Chitiniphilus shinanonensis]GLS06185.1 hypothetical protein GCM10007860_33550 [Chitiniphilus shinanonensis]